MRFFRTLKKAHQKERAAHENIYFSPKQGLFFLYDKSREICYTCITLSGFPTGNDEILFVIYRFTLMNDTI
jgi:hypothetical protein